MPLRLRVGSSPSRDAGMAASVEGPVGRGGVLRPHCGAWLCGVGVGAILPGPRAPALRGVLRCFSCRRAAAPGCPPLIAHLWPPGSQLCYVQGRAGAPWGLPAPPPLPPRRARRPSLHFPPALCAKLCFLTSEDPGAHGATRTAPQTAHLGRGVGRLVESLFWTP